MGKNSILILNSSRHYSLSPLISLSLFFSHTHTFSLILFLSHSFSFSLSHSLTIYIYIFNHTFHIYLKFDLEMQVGCITNVDLVSLCIECKQPWFRFHRLRSTILPLKREIKYTHILVKSVICFWFSLLPSLCRSVYFSRFTWRFPHIYLSIYCHHQCG